MSKVTALRGPKSIKIKAPTYSFNLPHNSEKMKELIVYVADKCMDKQTFCSTLLNKILNKSDFSHFRKHGVPITGLKYQKLKNGPTLCVLLPLQSEMVRNGDIVIAKKDYFGKVQTRLIPCRPANLKLFSGEEIATVDAVIEELCKLNATDVSRASHGVAWRVRDIGDPIPYEAAYLSDEPIDEHDIEKAKDLEKRFCAAC